MKRDKHAPKQKWMKIGCEKKTGKNGTEQKREKNEKLISMKRIKTKHELKKGSSQRQLGQQKMDEQKTK